MERRDGGGRKKRRDEVEETRDRVVDVFGSEIEFGTGQPNT